jgi:hypothetical protein
MIIVFYIIIQSCFLMMVKAMIHQRWENPINQRYYRVIFSRDLLGDWVVTKIWGGSNRAGSGTKNIPCVSYEDGMKLISKIADTRLKRGYQAVSV